jgi:hypothetical protein
LETDLERLKEKIAALEGVLFLRYQELAGKTGHGAECDAIKTAIENIRNIQETKFGYPPIELSKKLEPGSARLRAS